MWRCQLCQREFNDVELKHEMSTAMLQDIFKGVVVIDRNQTEDICYLCEDCNREVLRLIEEQSYWVNL
jgi:DNA-directed RNA polymerase subunit RPC12/RpoP